MVTEPAAHVIAPGSGTGDLLNVSIEPRPRNDAVWIKLRCNVDADCLLGEVYLEPASQAAHFVTTVQAAHRTLHATGEPS